jgi:pimeloyl-ACP methyl ester carboxylesterase
MTAISTARADRDARTTTVATRATSRAMSADRVELRAAGGPAGGPVAVVGHGLTLDARSLDPLVDGLAERGWRTLTWELPGHGAAPDHPTAWSVPDLARALGTSLGTAADAPLLIGVSLGGYVSLEAVASNAVRASGLVLIGCEGLPPPSADPARVRALAEWADGGTLPFVVAAAMAAAEVGAEHPEEPALVNRWRDTPDSGRRFLPGYLALFARPDPRPAAARVAALGLPALVIRGAGDPWVSTAAATVLADGLGGDLVEVAGAVHQPQWTHAGGTFAALDPFLARMA